MEKEDPIYIEILKIIGIYLITLLFIKTLLYIIKNIFNFFFTLSSFNKKLQVYFLSTIQIIETTCYFIC